MKRIVTVFVLVLMCLSGCAKKAKDTAVGTWEAADGPNYVIEFGPGGAMKLYKSGQELKVLGKPAITRYRFVDDNRVEAGDDASPGQFQFAVRVEEKQLVITGEGDSGLGGIGANGQWESFPPRKGEQQRFSRKP